MKNYKKYYTINGINIFMRIITQINILSVNIYVKYYYYIIYY